MRRQLGLLCPLLLTFACTPDTADLPDRYRDGGTPLVSARGWKSPIAKSHIVVDEDGLRLHDELLVQAVDGRLDQDAVERHLISSLHSRLDDDNEVWADEVLGVSAYADMPFADLVDILYTGGRAGFSNYALHVTAPDGSTKAILIAPPKFGPDGMRAVAASAPRLSIRNGNEEGDFRYELNSADGDASVFDDSITLTRALVELHAQNPDSHAVELTADGEVPHESVVAMLDLLAGPACDFETHDACMFSQPIVLAGG